MSKTRKSCCRTEPPACMAFVQTRKIHVPPITPTLVHMLWMYDQVHIQSHWGLDVHLVAQRLNLRQEEPQRQKDGTRASPGEAPLLASATDDTLDEKANRNS